MTQRDDKACLASVLQRLIEKCPHKARLIELVYWSEEPDLAEVMRHYVALTPELRATLHAFLILVQGEPGAAGVKITANGEMSFSSPAVAELARKVVEPDGLRPFLH